MKDKNIFGRKNSSYNRQYLRITIICLLIVSVLVLGTLRQVNKRVNESFESYIVTVTLSEDNLDEELEKLTHYLEKSSLRNRNKGIACNYISSIYGFKKQTQESVKYVSRALYYFEKAHQNSSLVQARINLSTILMNATSYDVAEKILQKALDVKLREEDEAEAHLNIYLNLTEVAYQKENYAQALEAIELAETKLVEVEELLEDEKKEWYEFRLNLSKARTYFGLKYYKECREVTSLVNHMARDENFMHLQQFTLPYYELSSMVALYDGKLKEAETCFKEYIDYCEHHKYDLMKLFFVDKFIDLACDLGYQDKKFVEKSEKYLLDDYRVQLGVTTNMNAKVMMEMYNTSVDNLRIRSEQNVERAKIFAGIVIVILVMVIGTAVIIQTYRRSQVDMLTGAYNRVKMRPVYRALLRKKQTFYVIMFDIDNFKMCNDVYGHRFGDTVLERISGTVMGCLPKTSLFFRYGGEEFVVLCELKEEEEVKELAETIRKAVEALSWETQSKITISIGVSRSGSNADPIKSADECLYVSKKTGKNKVTYSFIKEE